MVHNIFKGKGKKARNSRCFRSEAAKRGFSLSAFPVMNGVKRSETRVLSLARACHLPPLEMRYKSPLRNKFMNTLLAFRAALHILLLTNSSVRFYPSRSSCPYPIYPILLGTSGKFLNRPNHGVERRSVGRSDQPHILGRSPIGSPPLLSSPS